MILTRLWCYVNHSLTYLLIYCKLMDYWNGGLMLLAQVYIGRYDWLVSVYYSAYKECTVNVFALSSTWLTVVMAVSRYVVVCRPLHARGYISLRRTRSALLAVFVLSAVLNVPRLLRYSVVTSSCAQLGLADVNATQHCECVLYNKVTDSHRNIQHTRRLYSGRTSHLSGKPFPAP